jgi:hypothetical protein
VQPAAWSVDDPDPKLERHCFIYFPTVLCQRSQPTPPAMLEIMCVTPGEFHDLSRTARHGLHRDRTGALRGCHHHAKPPWMDCQSCEAVGKRMTEKLGGSYECTPYRSPTDVTAARPAVP